MEGNVEAFVMKHGKARLWRGINQKAGRCALDVVLYVSNLHSLAKTRVNEPRNVLTDKMHTSTVRICTARTNCIVQLPGTRKYITYFPSHPYQRRVFHRCLKLHADADQGIIGTRSDQVREIYLALEHDRFLIKANLLWVPNVGVVTLENGRPRSLGRDGLLRC
jgi:hypothetical protein